MDLVHFVTGFSINIPHLLLVERHDKIGVLHVQINIQLMCALEGYVAQMYILEFYYQIEALGIRFGSKNALHM